MNLFLSKLVICSLALLTFALPLPAQPNGNSARPQYISLRDCIETTLMRNRTLQIERINPEIARLAISESYGYYDPILVASAEKAEDNDPGGFDPLDPSRDAVYSADSEIAGVGLTGLLPSGLSYNLSGAYAHSDGERNFTTFDSYKLGGRASVRQPLLRNFWTDQGRTTIRINKKNLRISELGLTYLIMDTVNLVQQAYYELLFAREHLQVRERLLTAKQDTLNGVKRQVEVGALTVLEERLAISEVARVQAELVAASNAVVLAENALKTLLGHSTADWVEGAIVPMERLIIVPEPLSFSGSWQSGFVRRPDLAQMRVMVDRADIDLKYRYNQLFPFLDVFAAYGRRGASAVQTNNATGLPPIPPLLEDASLSAAWEQIEDADAPSHTVGVLLSTPLSRVRERSSYKASKQLKQQAELVVKQREEWILREVSDAIANARSAKERAAATRQYRDYTKSALEAEVQKLSGGKSSLFFVYQLQTDLANAEAAEVRARADYNKAVSQLSFAEGSILERNQIAVESK